MELDHVRKVYEELGREDPLYAVLAKAEYRGNRWDPAEFFREGVLEIGEVRTQIESCGIRLDRRDRALDFGCGVGRLTQALANHFREVVGVDISHTMVEAARRYDRHGDRVRYLVNTKPDLSLLESGSFDFVYSSKTLQHIPPGPAAGYIREFMRVLRPGGLAVFQVRNGPRIEPGTFRSWLYTLRRQHIRRVWQRVRGRPAYEMHYIARSRVEELIEESGGRIVDVVDLRPERPGKSLRYSATR